MNTLDFIMDLESGQCTPTQVIDGFANLIKVGLAWKLQGFYGRTAQNLIEGGYISTDGDVLKYAEEQS